MEESNSARHNVTKLTADLALFASLTPLLIRGATSKEMEEASGKNYQSINAYLHGMRTAGAISKSPHRAPIYKFISPTIITHHKLTQEETDTLITLLVSTISTSPSPSQRLHLASILSKFEEASS